ncbi:DUF3892 domain-containing protein [Oceanobacillus longus]|uniref:DUF3892 domain-containing protein n=1 Tax=Oceanobacillus longus TaxID=930120 RepID=A0ABV8GTM1_9BACI
MEGKDFEKIYNDYREQNGKNGFSEQINMEGKEAIIAVRKNDSGDLIAFKTNTGRELDYMTALDEAKSGNIAHIDVFHKYGRDIIRSEPDGIKENNLDNLPLF